MKVTKFKQVVLSGLLLLIIICLFSQIHSAVQLPQSIVAVVQSTRANASDLQEADIKAMVTEAVNLAGGFNGIIQNGDTVVIKPNLVLGEIATGTLPPQVNGITTDYRVIKAIVELVREINPNGIVYVMEG